MTGQHAVTPKPSNAQVEIEYFPDFVRVRLIDTEPKLSFDHSFHERTLFYRRIIPRGQALLKACSNKQRSIRNVLDITAGWGIDSFILAQHGRQVTMLEQNPLLASILSTSLENARNFAHTNQAAQRITLINCNSVDFLSSQCSSGDFQCIYLDPMFPQRGSGAKPGKDMQLLQQLTTNLDIKACFDLAMQKAGNRVVVKRPAKAPALTPIRPDLIYRENSIRFDVYLTS